MYRWSCNFICNVGTYTSWGDADISHHANHVHLQATTWPVWIQWTCCKPPPGCVVVCYQPPEINFWDWCTGCEKGERPGASRLPCAVIQLKLLASQLLTSGTIKVSVDSCNTVYLITKIEDWWDSSNSFSYIVFPIAYIEHLIGLISSVLYITFSLCWRLIEPIILLCLQSSLMINNYTLLHVMVVKIQNQWLHVIMLLTQARPTYAMHTTSIYIYI